MKKTDDLNGMPPLLAVQGIYNPKAYHLLSKRKITKTLTYLFILAFIINLFTVILPYSPIILENKGVKHILEVLVPDFEYSNGEITIPEFKCDINDKENSITLIDTNKEMAAEILTEYSSGIAVGKTKAYYKTNGQTTEYVYKDIIPIESISKEILISTKTIFCIYLFLALIILFANIFLFIMLLVEALIMYIILSLINICFFKIKFSHKFRSLFNVGAYSLAGATILKSFLHTFNIAPLPFQFFHWITILQIAICLTISCLGLIDIKRHKEANTKLRNEMDSTLTESEKLDIELGFEPYELQMKEIIKNDAIKLNNELKQNINNNKKEDK